MEQKKKAKELVEKYKPFVYCYSGSGMLINQVDESIILRNAKQCALIAVDEILDMCSVFTKDYWQEVKQEIINL